MSGDFTRLWFGESVSILGIGISRVAFPLIAVVSLQASPAAMGLLRALANTPEMLIGPLIGVWVDRVRRRRLLVGLDVAAMFLIGSIPLLSHVGLLSLPYLFTVTFLIGVIEVPYGAAFLSYLPMLVQTEDVVKANSRFQISFSVAGILGPSLGGALVRVFTAPFALVADCVTYLASIAGLLSIRHVEPALPPRGFHHILRDMREGLAFLLDSRSVRFVVALGAASGLFAAALVPVYVIFLVRTLHMNAVIVGASFGVGGLGAIAGALLTSRIGHLFGELRALAAATFVGGISLLPVALAGRFPAFSLAIVISAAFVAATAAAVSGIIVVSLIQTLCPTEIRGRVIADFRSLSALAAVAGSLAGGVLGEVTGLSWTIAISALGQMLVGSVALRGRLSVAS